MLKFFKFGPDGCLSFFESSIGSRRALIDWSTSSKSVIEVLVVPAGLEDKDDNHDVKDGKSNKDETEYLSTSESGDETSMAALSTSEGNSGVGIDSDSHALQAYAPVSCKTLPIHFIESYIHHCCLSLGFG